MILKTLISNPLGGEKKPWKPWYGYIFLIMFVTSIGLYAYQRMNGGPIVPTSVVPSVAYESARLAREQESVQQEEAGDEEDSSTMDALKEVAKVTVDMINSKDDALVTALPSAANLAVPFTSQAPFANWDLVHEDTCEEASVLMVAEYFDGISENIDPQKADDAMLEMITAETHQGLSTSLTARELGTFAEAYFETVTATVIEDPTIDEIKAYIVDGIPVIVPAAGRELGNPFYAGEGPLYHYFVIRGFDGDTFITNDPGTRRGENYTYAQSVIMDAMGDWNSGDPANGVKRILVLKPR